MLTLAIRGGLKWFVYRVSVDRWTSPGVLPSYDAVLVQELPSKLSARAAAPRGCLVVSLRFPLLGQFGRQASSCVHPILPCRLVACSKVLCRRPVVRSSFLGESGRQAISCVHPILPCSILAVQEALVIWLPTELNQHLDYRHDSGVGGLTSLPARV